MNSTFTMEITVQQLQYPLLHERLRSCNTPRERAAVFKALAEAQLRRDMNVGRGVADTRLPAGRPLESEDIARSASTPAGQARPVTTPQESIMPLEAQTGFDAVRVDDSDETGGVFGSHLENASFF